MPWRSYTTLSPRPWTPLPVVLVSGGQRGPSGSPHVGLKQPPLPGEHCFCDLRLLHALSPSLFWSYLSLRVGVCLNSLCCVFYMYLFKGWNICLSVIMEDLWEQEAQRQHCQDRWRVFRWSCPPPSGPIASADSHAACSCGNTTRTRTHATWWKST